MTKAEARLWLRMWSNGLGAPFRRQHPIGPYFADFYCASVKIVVELDGSQHADRAEYDAARTAYLRRLGIDVLRFWNSDVMENLEGVCLDIANAIRKRQVLQTLAPGGGPPPPPRDRLAVPGLKNVRIEEHQSPDRRFRLR